MEPTVLARLSDSITCRLSTVFLLFFNGRINDTPRRDAFHSKDIITTARHNIRYPSPRCFQHPGIQAASFGTTNIRFSQNRQEKEEAARSNVEAFDRGLSESSIMPRSMSGLSAFVFLFLLLQSFLSLLAMNCERIPKPSD